MFETLTGNTFKVCTTGFDNFGLCIGNMAIFIISLIFTIIFIIVAVKVLWNVASHEGIINKLIAFVGALITIYIVYYSPSIIQWILS